MRILLAANNVIIVLLCFFIVLMLCLFLIAGKSLLDVIVLCVDEEAGLKDMLPVIGSLKHMRAWHSAQMFMVSEHSAG